jgi:hypothetical protein
MRPVRNKAHQDIGLSSRRASFWVGAELVWVVRTTDLYDLHFGCFRHWLFFSLLFPFALLCPMRHIAMVEMSMRNHQSEYLYRPPLESLS